jgi:hypothetical protein
VPARPLLRPIGSASARALQFPHSTYFGGIQVLQYEHYELDNMTEAFGKLAF